LEWIRKIIVCNISPVTYSTESISEDAHLHRDGRNFASWYRHQLLERQENVPAYIKAIQEVIPGFRNIRLEKVGLDSRALMVMFEQFDQKYELRLDEISDGQRALLTLYALTKLAASQGYTLFLDEPDNFVALAEIQPWLIELNDSCGSDVQQAVICSHHPEMIDYLGPDKGVFLNQEKSGVTIVKPIHSVATIGKAQPKLKLSELIARGWES
jgi:predicted ATPase